MLNKLLFVLGAVLAVGGPVAGIVQKERLLAHGRTVLLELVPTDPRSLMQGDYMALRYQLVQGRVNGSGEGLLVLRDDDLGVGRFVRVEDGSPLAPLEYRVRYHRGSYEPRIAGDAFFFQEGSAQTYARARYGELKVAPSGEAILVGLRGPDREPLGKGGLR
jgi:uncharacterized membrane-anchored protein